MTDRQWLAVPDSNGPAHLFPPDPRAYAPCGAFRHRLDEPARGRWRCGQCLWNMPRRKPC